MTGLTFIIYLVAFIISIAVDAIDFTMILMITFIPALGIMKAISNSRAKKHKKEHNIDRTELKAQGIPSCPKCGSTHVTTLYGRGASYNACGNCGYEYYPSTDTERI